MEGAGRGRWGRDGGEEEGVGREESGCLGGGWERVAMGRGGREEWGRGKDGVTDMCLSRTCVSPCDPNHESHQCALTPTVHAAVVGVVGVLTGRWRGGASVEVVWWWWWWLDAGIWHTRVFPDTY